MLLTRKDAKQLGRELVLGSKPRKFKFTRVKIQIDLPQRKTFGREICWEKCESGTDEVIV